jgi:hypothetical protein
VRYGELKGYRELKGVPQPPSKGATTGNRNALRALGADIGKRRKRRASDKVVGATRRGINARRSFGAGWVRKILALLLRRLNKRSANLKNRGFSGVTRRGKTGLAGRR